MNTLIPAELNEIVLVGPMGPDIIHPLSDLPQIAIDGGEPFAQTPFLWIGDGDSLKKKPKTYQTIELNPKKDMSDLAHAYTLLKSHPLKKLHLWGFLGGRRDHELFNLGEGSLFLKDRIQTQIHYYKEKSIPVMSLYTKGEWHFDFKGEFSLGVMNEAHLTLLGEIAYPISESYLIRPFSSFGLSNEAQGKFLIQADGPFFIIREFHERSE